MKRHFLLGLAPALLLVLGINHFATSSAPAEDMSAAEFQQLSLRLSEKSGFFGTDNLVSNETSFLHVREMVREFSRSGQAYVGVGPDQNFTYIAQSRPSLAFIIDIRRDNLLQHLYFKAIFQEASNREQYMSRLFGRPLSAGEAAPASERAVDLVERFEKLSPDLAFFNQSFEGLFERLRGQYPELVQEADRSKLWSIASAFFEDGLEVRYEIPGRPMLTFFPSYAQLMTETDTDGEMGHYLNSEEDFQFLKKMQETNRIVPVVGNFGGTKALKAIGDELKRRGLKVSIFYLSNVEFYLFRNGIYRRFIENVRNLPVDGNSLFIRSYFNNWFGTWRTHPNAVPNYFSTSLAQRIQRFLQLDDAQPYENYWDLVTRDYLGAPARASTVF